MTIKKKPKLKKKVKLNILGVVITFTMIIVFLKCLTDAVTYHNLPICFGIAIGTFFIIYFTWIIISDAIKENNELKKTYKPRHGSKSK